MQRQEKEESGELGVRVFYGKNREGGGVVFVRRKKKKWEGECLKMEEKECELQVVDARRCGWRFEMGSGGGEKGDWRSGECWRGMGED